MNFTSMKIKPLVLALGVTALFASTSSFAVMQTVTTNTTISGMKPYIPYVHVKSSSGYLQVGSTLSFTGSGETGFVFKQVWTNADETTLHNKVADNTSAVDGVSGKNEAGGSLVFVDADGDQQTFIDRANSDKVMIQWYKIPELLGKNLTQAEITAALATAGSNPPADWTHLANATDYTLQLTDLNYQIAAVIVPMTATGDPDKNSVLVIPNVLQFAGQKIDVSDPNGTVDANNSLQPGPNPDITPPKDGGYGVEPKIGADLRLVIHTDKTYHDAYIAYLADTTNPLPAVSSITADKIFADNLDGTAGSGNKLKTDTIYYATVVTTGVTGSTTPSDYTVDVTDEYKDSLTWSYVDAGSSFEIDNDTKMTFRTLRNSNLSGKGDIDGSGSEPVNDGSVLDRVKTGQDIENSANLTSPTGKGLNEQGFSIRFAVDDGKK